MDKGGRGVKAVAYVGMLTGYHGQVYSIRQISTVLKAVRS